MQYKTVRSSGIRFAKLICGLVSKAIIPQLKQKANKNLSAVGKLLLHNVPQLSSILEPSVRHLIAQGEEAAEAGQVIRVDSAEAIPIA